MWHEYSQTTQLINYQILFLLLSFPLSEIIYLPLFTINIASPTESKLSRNQDIIHLCPSLRTEFNTSEVLNMYWLKHLMNDIYKGEKMGEKAPGKILTKRNGIHIT